MWAFKKNQTTLGYGVGTIHLETRLLNIPEYVFEISRCARDVFIELDIEKHNDAIIACSTEAAKMSVNYTDLSPSLQQKMDEMVVLFYEKTIGMSEEDMAGLLNASSWKQGGVYNFLSAVDILTQMKSNITSSTTLDADLSALGKGGEVETVATQCGVLAAISNRSLAYAEASLPALFDKYIREINGTKTADDVSTKDLVEEYKCGPSATDFYDKVMPDLLVQPDDVPVVVEYKKALTEALIYKRDSEMAEFMAKDMAGVEAGSKEPAVYAVGTGHYKGILPKLEAQGYTVERLTRSFSNYTKCPEVPTSNDADFAASGALATSVPLSAYYSVFALLALFGSP